MTQTDPNFINTNASEPEAYDTAIDRFFIRVGDLTTRYFGVLIGLAIFGLIGLGMIIGSVLIVRSVGQRINDIQVRVQERQVFIDQQIQQTTNQSDRLATKRQKTVDESGWFIILEDGEELPSEDLTEEEDALIKADASQQFVRPGLQNQDILNLDDLSDFKSADEAVSN